MIVSTPSASLSVTSDGLLNVTVTVSFSSSVISARTAMVTFLVVSLGAKVSVPEPAV